MVQCAAQLEERYSEDYKEVVWFLVTDSTALRHWVRMTLDPLPACIGDTCQLAAQYISQCIRGAWHSCLGRRARSLGASL